MTNRLNLFSLSNYKKNVVNNTGIFAKIAIYFFMIIFAVFISVKLINILFISEYTKDMLAAEFRTDINKLWEASLFIELSRVEEAKNMNKYGSFSKINNLKEITSSLKKGLIKIADINKDQVLSVSEIEELGLATLNHQEYRKALKNLQYNNLKIDNNLNHYLIITKGDQSGTILYNGILNIVDAENKHYLGVGLYLLENNN